MPGGDLNAVRDPAGSGSVAAELAEHRNELGSRLARTQDYMMAAFGALVGQWGVQSPVESAVHGAMREPGKMIRATIIIKAYQAVGGDPDLITAAAAGIEYGHLASLVHDDLIDGDLVRRNQPAVWAAFGVPQAIISGDMLFFSAFHSLAHCWPAIPADRIVRALECVARAGIDTCFGASLEMVLTGCLVAPVDSYLKMAAGKTGSLIRGAAEGGAILGGGSDEQVAALRDYGDNLGIAFQIVDDLLPYISDEETLGKSVESDIRNRRSTLPALIAAHDSDEESRVLLTEVFDAELTSAADIERAHRLMLECIARTGAIDKARHLADGYCTTAAAALEALSENKATQTLRLLIEAVRGRNS
jgi:geranylgeranyl diphosphate synthase, type I